MAQELVDAMVKFGFPTFTLVGHDRGGRVAYRMAVDHEEYRAAATIDVEHDRADKAASRRIECPMFHPWAEGGPLDTFYAKDGGPPGI